jgi:TIR domain
MPLAIARTVQPRRIFVSYSHLDYADARALHMELQAMSRRLHDVVLFMDCEGDGKLVAGDEWRQRIRTELETADVFVLLLSTPFIDSEFCREVEMRRAFERCKADPNVRLVGIALHELNLDNFSLRLGTDRMSMSERQVLPQAEVDTAHGPKLGLKPISLWPESRRRDAWARVAMQLEEALLASERRMAGVTPKTPHVHPDNDGEDTTWLPYLCDRDDQFFALGSAVTRWKDTGFKRPLLLISDGRAEDCPLAWVDRLHKVEIAELLGLEDKGLAFGYCKPLVWPSTGAAVCSADEVSAKIRLALAHALGPRPLASIGEVFDTHAKSRRPAMLWVDFPDNAPAAQVQLSLKALLRLLAVCPDLTLDTALVIALNLIRGSSSSCTAGSRLAPIFEAEFANRSTRRSICAAGLGILGELDAAAIRKWSNHRHVQGRLVDNVELLQKELPKGRQSWPMRDFVEHARGWLKNTNARG